MPDVSTNPVDPPNNEIKNTIMKTPWIVRIVICYSVIVLGAHISQHAIWISYSFFYNQHYSFIIFWTSFFSAFQILWLPALIYITKKKLHLRMSPFWTKCCSGLLVMFVLAFLFDTLKVWGNFVQSFKFIRTMDFILNDIYYFMLSAFFILICVIILANIISDIHHYRIKKQSNTPDCIVESKAARWTYWVSYVPVFGLLLVLLFGSFAVYRMGKYFESGFSYLKRAFIVTLSINLLLFILYFSGVFTGFGIFPKHGRYPNQGITFQSGEYFYRYYWFGKIDKVIWYYKNGIKKQEGGLLSPSLDHGGKSPDFTEKTGTWSYWDEQGNLIKEEFYDPKGKLIKTIQHKSENK